MANLEQVEHEITFLLKKIAEIGENQKDGKFGVKYGVLFDDEEGQQFFEALVGTLKAAKKRKAVDFKGQMLLKGAHDNVVIYLLKPGDASGEVAPAAVKPVAKHVAATAETGVETAVTMDFQKLKASFSGKAAKAKEAPAGKEPAKAKKFVEPAKVASSAKAPVKSKTASSSVLDAAAKINKASSFSPPLKKIAARGNSSATM